MTETDIRERWLCAALRVAMSSGEDWDRCMSSVWEVFDTPPPPGMTVPEQMQEEIEAMERAALAMEGRTGARPSEGVAVVVEPDELDDLSDEELTARAPHDQDWPEAQDECDGTGLTLDELLGNIDEELKATEHENLQEVERRYDQAQPGGIVVVPWEDIGDDEPACATPSPHRPWSYLCTRSPGHQGQHVAEDRRVVLVVWPNE